MAFMLLLCRATAAWGAWLWPAGGAAVALAFFAPDLHAVLSLSDVWDGKGLNWIGLISHKPITEDYVPVLPWLGVMWWGMATGQLILARRWVDRLVLTPEARPLRSLAWIGRWSLSWYMVHQPLLIGLLTLVVPLR